MAQTQKICTSTGKSVTNDTGSVSFDCPKCGKHKIVRSYQARKTGAQYVCPCGDFTGPA